MFKIHHHVYHFFKRRWDKHYSKSHWHLVLDLSLSIVVIFLLAVVIGFYFFPTSFPSLGRFVPNAINLNNPPLSLNFSANNKVIYPNKAINLQVNIKNGGAVNLSNITIDFSVLNDNFSLDKLELASSSLRGTTVNGTNLTIASLSPYQRGEVMLKAYFKTASNSSQVLSWLAQSKYNFKQQSFQETSNLPELKVASDFQAVAAAYYTSPQGDQLGIGPVPPIVGIPTVYWVFWDFNSPADFNNLIFSAHLPKGVSLGPNQSLLSGQFNYSPGTRLVIWKVSKLSGSADRGHLGFEVKITPTSQEVGQIITLLDKIQYYVTDSFTGKTVSGHLDPLTTNLKADRFNSGQGKVIPQ